MIKLNLIRHGKYKLEKDTKLLLALEKQGFVHRDGDFKYCFILTDKGKKAWREQLRRD